MTMRPATHSTDDPPCQIHDIELAEYIWSLRRRIEVQNDLMAALATNVQTLQTEVDKLSLDLHLQERTAKS